MELVPLHELFDIKYGNSLELTNLEQCKKGHPNSINFVSRTERNNGISAFVLKVEGVTPNPANTITVAVGGSVLATFLQPEPYYTGFHVLVLNPRKEMRTDELLFYTMCIRRNKYKYNYGRQANKTLKDVLVPRFMPQEFAAVDYRKLGSVSSQSVIDQDLELDTSNWRYFTLNSLFRIFKGHRLTKAQMQRGKTPYISSSSFNNGVDVYISEEPNFKKNFLTFACYGSIGEVFYHPYDAWVSDNCNVMYLRDYGLNGCIAIFLIGVIKKEQYRFSYGFTGKLQTLRKLQLKLPSKSGVPDFEFMERYIKSLPYSSNL